MRVLSVSLVLALAALAVAVFVATHRRHVASAIPENGNDRYPSSADNFTLPSAVTGDADPLPSLLWMAPIISGGGYCSEAVAFLRALHPYLTLAAAQHGDTPSLPFFYGLSDGDQSLLRTLTSRAQTIDTSASVVVCHSEPGAWTVSDDLPALYSTPQCPPPGFALSIARTMFETDRLPESWSERLNGMDYVWVPTQFAYEVFRDAGVSASKLRVITEPIDTDIFDPAITEAAEYQRGERRAWETGQSQRPYRFLSVGKVEERKGWTFLLDAYLCEFARESAAVELWLLTSSYHSDEKFSDRITRFQRDELSCRHWFNGTSGLSMPPVRLLRSHLPTTQMPSVYLASDAFVLATRGEGFGRPPIEAMAMELPVIVTNWSGPTAFMHERHSYPLRVEGMDTVATGAFQGHQWAKPDVSHLRTLMRAVYSDRAEAQRRGKLARAYVLEHFRPAVVARAVLDELKSLQPVIAAKRRG